MSRRTRRTAEWPTEPPAAMGRGSSWTTRRTVPTAMSCRLRKLRLVAVPLSVVWDVCINSCVNPLLSYPACWRFGWVFNPTSRGSPADIRRTFRNASTSPSPHMYILRPSKYSVIRGNSIPVPIPREGREFNLRF